MSEPTPATEGAACLSQPQSCEADLDAVRTALTNLAMRVDQVRGALEGETRALDDRTLAQMLDTTTAWSALRPVQIGDGDRNV